jgi:hypothetical protein
MGKKRNTYRLLIGKPVGNRPLGRPKCWWVDNIKMDLVEIGLGELDWIVLAQDRYRGRVHVNTVMDHQVP